MFEISPEGCVPHQVYESESLLRRFQYRLLVRGVPLAWAIDAPDTHLLFVPTQMLILGGAILAGSERFHSLEVRPDQPLARDEETRLLRAGLRLVGAPVPAALSNSLAARAEVDAVLEGVGITPAQLHDPPTWRELCRAFAPLMIRAIAAPQWRTRRC